MNVFLGSIQPAILFGFNLLMICLVLQNRRKVTGNTYYFALAAGFAAAFLLGYLLQIFELVLIWPYIYIASYFLLTLFLCGLLFRCRLAECVFLYFVIQTYVDDTFMMAKILQYYVISRLTDNILAFYPAQYAALLIGLPLIYTFSRDKLRLLIDATAGLKFWRYIWMMPLSFYIVYRIGISAQYVNLDSVWEHTNIVVPLFWAVATILAYFLVISTLLEVVKHVEDREKLEATNRQLQMQKEQYQKLSESIEETRRLRHDMSHQMQVIAAYVQNGDWEKIKSSVGSYIEQIEEEELPICANHAVDSIVQYYRRTAKQAGIHMTVTLETLSELPCNEVDVCVILGNLLENAMESCLRQKRGERSIELKLNTGSQNLVAIQLRNSCSDPICKTGRDYLSAKRNFDSLGIGISSVRKIADRYHGIAKFERDGEEFCTKVLLNRM